MECSRCGKAQDCKRGGKKRIPGELDKTSCSYLHVTCQVQVKFLPCFLPCFVNMHMTVDHVGKISVLYELLYCISFKIFITQSELEVKEIHNRCKLLANFIKLQWSSCYKLYAEIQANFKHQSSLANLVWQHTYSAVQSKKLWVMSCLPLPMCFETYLQYSPIHEPSLT